MPDLFEMSESIGVYAAGVGSFSLSPIDDDEDLEDEDLDDDDLDDDEDDDLDLDDEDDLDDDDDEEDDHRWLWVPCEGSRDGYRDMELFTALVEDRDLAARLERALTGRGVFRRFKDVLAESPTELQQWYSFSDERQRGRARAWLAAEGYATTA